MEHSLKSGKGTLGFCPSDLRSIEVGLNPRVLRVVYVRQFSKHEYCSSKLDSLRPRVEDQACILVEVRSRVRVEMALLVHSVTGSE
jgi:hypothetical protein